MSMQELRLFLILLKSPLYVLVIFGGMSPLEMRSTYAAVTFKGPITASSVALRPSIIGAELRADQFRDCHGFRVCLPPRPW